MVLLSRQAKITDFVKKSYRDYFGVNLGDQDKSCYVPCWLRVVIYKALCFDVGQGRMNGAPNETRTHSCRFARLAC